MLFLVLCTLVTLYDHVRVYSAIFTPSSLLDPLCELVPIYSNILFSRFGVQSFRISSTGLGSSQHVVCSTSALLSVQAMLPSSGHQNGAQAHASGIERLWLHPN